MANQNQELDLVLIQRARDGEITAKEELVKKYLPMVRYIVRNHYASFLEWEDLVQEGVIGFLSAIEEYDHERFDVKFSSFAYICILRKIYNVIKQTSGNKHRLLNDAVSLYTYVNAEETRTMLELIDAEEADPFTIFEDRQAVEVIDKVLHEHLSLLEYNVTRLIVAGYSCAEIEAELGIAAKAVDNARTRVKVKLKRILENYGTLLNPHVPAQVRKRTDLYLPIPVRSHVSNL